MSYLYQKYKKKEQIQDWILKYKRIRKQIVRFFTNWDQCKISRIMVYERSRRIPVLWKWIRRILWRTMIRVILD